VDIKALITYVALVLIPVLPLTSTWLRFLQQRGSNISHGHLTLEFPLFVTSASCLLFLGSLIHDDRVSESIYDRVPSLIWLNVGLSLSMVVLALMGKHPIRSRLAGSAAAVFFRLARQRCHRRCCPSWRRLDSLMQAHFSSYRCNLPVRS